MRRFQDAEGSVWDVVLGRASWGALYALFVPAGHDAVIRQAPFQPRSPASAEAELDALDEAALNALFERSTPKED
jgi:hypothetical protein